MYFLHSKTFSSFPTPLLLQSLQGTSFNVVYKRYLPKLLRSFLKRFLEVRVDLLDWTVQYKLWCCTSTSWDTNLEKQFWHVYIWAVLSPVTLVSSLSSCDKVWTLADLILTNVVGGVMNLSRLRSAIAEFLMSSLNYDRLTRPNVNKSHTINQWQIDRIDELLAQVGQQIPKTSPHSTSPWIPSDKNSIVRLFTNQAHSQSAKLPICEPCIYVYMYIGRKI